MIFKLLKFSLLIAIIPLFFMIESKVYAVQTDSRGFPITQPTGSSFGVPSANTSFGAPIVSSPTIPSPSISNRPHYPHRFYYFDYSGYPYYVYPSDLNTSYYFVETTDNQNNSVSLPKGKWISANDGEVPDQAIVYQTGNNSTYYCRARYRYIMYYGVLTPGEGCLVQNENVTIRLNHYEVLVSY